MLPDHEPQSTSDIRLCCQIQSDREDWLSFTPLNTSDIDSRAQTARHFSEHLIRHRETEKVCTEWKKRESIALCRNCISWYDDCQSFSGTKSINDPWFKLYKRLISVVLHVWKLPQQDRCKRSPGYYNAAAHTQAHRYRSKRVKKVILIF